jgi:hypothetical protein
MTTPELVDALRLLFPAADIEGPGDHARVVLERRAGDGACTEGIMVFVVGQEPIGTPRFWAEATKRPRVRVDARGADLRTVVMAAAADLRRARDIAMEQAEWEIQAARHAERLAGVADVALRGGA